MLSRSCGTDSTSKDGGTLLQLKNIINRRNIGKYIFGRVNEVEDFIELVVSCHLLAAALHYFGMQSVSDSPHSNGFDAQISQRSLAECTRIVRARMEDIIHNYVISRGFSSSIPGPTSSCTNPHSSRIQLEHSYGFVPPQHRHFPRSLSDVFCRPHASEPVRAAAPDRVFNYASAILNDGLLLCVKDALLESICNVLSIF